MSRSLDELISICQNEPASELCLELVSILEQQPNRRAEAREVCFKGIKANPKFLRLRLALAKLFYLDGYNEYSARELMEIRKYSTVPSLLKLLDAFGEYVHLANISSASDEPGGGSNITEQSVVKGTDSDGVLAEIDFESEFLNALGEIEDEK